MQFFENEIKEYVEFSWSTLDLKITPSSEPFHENSGNLVTAHIKISGHWQGVIALTIEHGLAQQLAVKMFAIEQGQVTDDEIHDAVSEMTNIIGGNIKSILPQPSKLSLPITDLKGSPFHFPFTQQLSRVIFDCMGKSFMVTIHQALEQKNPIQPSKTETYPVS